MRDDSQRLRCFIILLFTVILEGIVEATGLTTQARTSYLPSEIRWGYRFEKVVRPFRDGSVRIDHDYFNKIYLVETTPRCSPRELYQLQQQQTEEEEKADKNPPTKSSRNAGSSSRHGSIATIPLIRLPAHLTVPSPTQQVRRRQSSPIMLPESVAVAADRTASQPSLHIRRASASTVAAAPYQDPLSCASDTHVLPLQNVELPRIR